MNRRLLQRYVITGGSAYIIEMLVLLGLRDGLRLGSVASVAISFWVGFAVAFLLQKFIAFENHEKKTRVVAKQLGFYAILAGWNYIFTLIIVSLFASVASVFVLRTLAIIIITMWNFLVYKKLFSAPKDV